MRPPPNTPNSLPNEGNPKAKPSHRSRFLTTSERPRASACSSRASSSSTGARSTASFGIYLKQARPSISRARQESLRNSTSCYPEPARINAVGWFGAQRRGSVSPSNEAGRTPRKGAPQVAERMQQGEATARATVPRRSRRPAAERRQPDRSVRPAFAQPSVASRFPGEISVQRVRRALEELRRSDIRYCTKLTLHLPRAAEPNGRQLLATIRPSNARRGVHTHRCASSRCVAPCARQRPPPVGRDIGRPLILDVELGKAGDAPLERNCGVEQLLKVRAARFRLVRDQGTRPCRRAPS